MKLKKSQLKELIKQSIFEVDAEKAKKMGLKSKGFGNWVDPKSGQHYSTKGGKLHKVDSSDPDTEKKKHISKDDKDKLGKLSKMMDKEKPKEKPKTTSIDTNPYGDDDVGGPAHPNVPKGAKSSKDLEKKTMKAATDANKKMEIDVLNQKAEEGNGELIDTEYNGSVVWDHGDPNEDTFFAIDGDGETVELDYSDIIRFQNDGEDESMLKSVQESVKESYPSFAKMYQKIKR